jgi:2-polyprenyl-3-methyl-5-hydroxy-6-metoxy-1,4-benzoquinol methylase
MNKNTKFNPSYIGERPYILSQIPANTKTLLDVGCSDGTFGFSIKSKIESVTVTGIEFDPIMAAAAKEKLDDVLKADLNQESLTALLEGREFDCIVMADILEHLIDPWARVREAASLLSDKGVLITSIPNIRHISSILSFLIKGKWPYRNRGIHDRTHLRFFTRSNILDMIQDAGLKVQSEKRNLRIIESGSRINRMAFMLDLPVLKSFFTFQYIHVSTRADKY